MSRRLRESENYLWPFDDYTIREETGTIYKGIHKKKGHLRFVKVFIRECQELAEREFEVLQKLDHANVIKLWALETDTLTKEFVGIMEYCNGGSLLSILERPENIYGMPEKDFLCLLHDLASGLKHLQDHDIVHRNINPKNIQCHTEDGRHVFKLNNFGTARPLEKGGVYKSFYGEPDYQCPEVFERDVLKREGIKPFSSATVDLWSIGVTLYQAATGRLPFQPYGGPRKNAKVMYQMMSEKASGCISAIQNSQDEPISWSQTLPETCELSLGLQNLICPLLAALLESKSEHAMTFQAFFLQVSAINEKLIVLVFNVIDFSLLHIYCNPNTSISEFHDLIKLQTDVPVTSQHLFYECHPFTDMIKNTFPRTSPSSPMFLFCTDQQPRIKSRPTLPKCPEVVMEINRSEDFLLAKQFSTDSRSLHRLTATLHLKQQLLEKAANVLHFVLFQDVSEVKDQIERFASLVMTEFLQRMSLISHSQSIMSQILNPLRRQSVEIEGALDQHCMSAKKIRNEVEEMHEESMRLYNEIGGNTFGSSESFNISSCQGDQNICLKRMETLVHDADELASEFAKKMQWQTLAEVEEKMRLFEKRKLKETFLKGLKWVEENCSPNLDQSYVQTMKWYSKYQNVSEGVDRLKVKANDVAEMLKLLTNTVDELQVEMNEEWRRVCSEFEVRLLPVPSLLNCRDQGDVSRHRIYGGEFVFRVRKNLIKKLKKMGVFPKELPESSNVQETSSDTLPEKSPAMRPAQSSESYAAYETQDEPATLTD